MLKAIYNHYRLVFKPWVYHREGYKNFFFEGWFYKLVNAEKTEVLAIIPAIVKGDDAKCFTQILDGTSHRSSVIFNDIKDLESDDSDFKVYIGSNYFSRENIILDLKGDITVKGSLSFHDPVIFQAALLSPNVMGWYSYVPMMECNHAILSMSSGISGSLNVDGKLIDFTGGKAYLEKDWGSSFPEGYVWCQSNHFDNSDTSFMFSVAKIPWLTGSFTGFLSVFHYQGRQFTFATWNRSKMTGFQVDESKVSATLSKGRFSLEFTIDRGKASELIAPYFMNGLTKVTESLNSAVTLTLKEGTEVIFTGTGSHCGLDINGTKIEG